MNDIFSPFKVTRVSEELVSQIKESILDGKLNPGDRLPPERELAELWEVSRVTVREALRTLEKSGLIRIKPGIGGGSFITQINFEAIESNITDFIRFGGVSLEDLSEMRLIIEPTVAELAAVRRTDEHLKELEMVTLSCRKLINIDDPNIIAHVNFHRVLVKAAKNPILIANLNSVMNLLSDELKRNEPTFETAKEDQEYHEKIFMAVKNKDGKLAKKIMIDHIDTFGKIHVQREKTQPKNR